MRRGIPALVVALGLAAAAGGAAAPADSPEAARALKLVRQWVRGQQHGVIRWGRFVDDSGKVRWGTESKELYKLFRISDQ